MASSVVVVEATGFTETLGKTGATKSEKSSKPAVSVSGNAATLPVDG